MASDGPPLCHLPQLLSSHLLLPLEQPYGGGDRCLPAVLGLSPSICISLVHPHQVCDQQASFLQGHPLDASGFAVAPDGVVPATPEPFNSSSGHPSVTCRSSQTAPCPSSLLEPPCVAGSCVETVQQYAQHLGLSWCMAGKLSICRCSSHWLYQHRWECYRCTITAILCPIRPFLRLRISCYSSALKNVFQLRLKVYRSTLSLVFKFQFPGLQDDFILWNFIRSFELEHLIRPDGPPAWDLVKVLTFLCGPTFEPLSSRPLQVVTMKVLVLFALATAKRVVSSRPFLSMWLFGVTISVVFVEVHCQN